MCRVLSGSLGPSGGGTGAREQRVRRDASSGSGWTEVFVDVELASSCPVAEAVARGFSLLVLHELASSAECEKLRREASAAALARRRRSTILKQALLEDVPAEVVVPGQVRMPIVEMLGDESQTLCDQLLLRGVDRVHRALPTLLPALFGDSGIGSTPWPQVREEPPQHAAPSLGPSPSAAARAVPSITRDLGLVFTPGEPACNVYTAGGEFTPHEDGGSLTLLLPLSSADAFTGGGTGFWSGAARGTEARASGEHALHVRPESGPSFVLTPPAGTALIFGGNVTHAGEPVHGGERAVFVASFSNGSRAPTKRGLLDGLISMLAG
jgi:hypothetical protein